MSLVKRNSRWIVRNALAILVVLAFSSKINAQVWGPLGNGLKGDPVAHTVEEKVLLMVTDQGLNSHGRVFTMQAWTGLYWSPIASFQADSFSRIHAMKYFFGKVYIAGQFTGVRGLNSAKNIIAWNGASKKFESVPGMDVNTKGFVRINDMEVFDKKLIVAGAFSRSTNIEGQGVQAFNGLTWQAISSFTHNPNGEVVDLQLLGGDSLFCAGTFTQVNNKNSKGIFCMTKDKIIPYPDNTLKPYRLVSYKSVLYGAVEQGGQTYIYGFKTSFSDKISSSNPIYKLRDIVEFGDKIWVSGSVGVKINSQPRNVTLATFDGDNWAAAPGYQNGYSIDFFMLYTEERDQKKELQLYAAGENFTSASPRIQKTGKLYLTKGIISGKIYYDKDDNCKLTQGDEIVSDRLIRISPGPFYLRPDADGEYSAILDHGKYEVQVLQRQYWGVSSCADEVMKVELDEGENASGVDFPLNFTTEVEDLAIELTSYSGWLARRGGTQIYNIKTENTGSEKIRNGQVALEFNTNLNKSFKSFPPADSLVGNKAYFTIPSIAPGQALNIPFSMELPDTFSDDNLELIATVAPAENESATDDNESQLTQVVNDSTYENVKQVFPLPVKGESISKIDPDDGELNYLINFANFSEDTVRTIHVVDTIDVNLDIQYIQETGASHSYTTRVVNGPPGSNIAVVIWTFNNLDLVPNPERYNDMPGYAGFIGFKVKINNNVPLGTIISNRAELVFDYQHSELTNTVQTEVAEVISTGEEVELVNGLIKMYPNPSNGIITLEPTEGDVKIDANSIVVYNAVGQATKAAVNNTGMAKQINLEGASKGLYWITGQSNRGFFRKTLMVH